MTSAGTIWCRAYCEEEHEYASVEGVYSSIQGSPVIAHILSYYYIGNLEPNTNYYTYCVAENTRQIPMSNSFLSTERFTTTLVEPPYLSYLGNRITYNTIEIDALSNIRAYVWNHTVIHDVNYTYPTVTIMKSKLPRQVPRQQQFTLSWSSLQNATEYAISLYSEDLKNNATEQSIPSTTFFITTDIVRCPAIDNWNETAAGSYGELPCNTGYSGLVKRYCNYDGEWSSIINECTRNECPVSGDWNSTLSLTQVTLPCGSGFTGMMTRYCNANGIWSVPDRSSCVLLYCPAQGEWPRTPALTTHSIYCGTGYFGEKSRYCNGEGNWEEVIERECIAKQICPAEDGWASTYEGEYMIRSCLPGYEGSYSRYCGLGGIWSSSYDNCTRIVCPEDGIWPVTNSNTTATYPCPVGESGMITRTCTLDGIWDAMNTTQCVQIFCNEEGIWNRTLAGLTIPGPCHEGEYGASSRTCNLNGLWNPIDYSECYEQGCGEEDGWHAIPVGLTLRRDCPSGYSGYRYRHCAANGLWDDVNDDDCERLVCSEMNGFPETLSGTSVNVACGEHYHGNMTATCSFYGQWTAIDISNCIAIPTCEEDGIWPRTNQNTLRTLSCGSGVAGTKTRFCNANLQWGEIDDSNCVQLYCNADGDWPQTIAGVVAYQDCPNDVFGFVQRPCSVEGIWGTVDFSYCFDVWCSAYQGWPATGGGQLAILPCSAGFTGNQTRLCTTDGEWSTIDDSNCVVATCPAEDPWPETVHSTQRIERPCPIGYYGTMYRDCTLQGIWSVVDDSLCIRKSCLPDGSWPLTLSLTTVTQSCPAGYIGSITRTCGDGIWGETDYNCSVNYCPEEDGWYTAAGTSQVRDCPHGYHGTMTRVCMLSGEWGVIQDQYCEQIVCPAFDDWNQGYVDDVQVKACVDGGFAILTCSITGEWEGDPTQCYYALCPADGKWPITPPGTIRRSTCPNGMEGHSSRYCSATGEWFEENLSQCVLTTCPAEGNWPETPRDSWATIGCPSHATGLRSRYCNSNSQWLLPDESSCINHSCPADDIWPMTSIGNKVILTCGLGKRGYRSRSCGEGGIWEDADESSCSQIVCYEEGDWPTTNALETATLPCLEGWIGSKNRTCSAGGIWSPVMDSCRQRTCPIDSLWPETIINTYATITCPPGYSGTYKRYCTADGSWNDADMSTCIRLYCPTDGIWLRTNTLEYASIPCGGDLLGSIVRYCNEDQTWSEPDQSQCHPNYCVAENGWPNTPINGTVSISCGTGYRGMQVRSCSADAYWNEVDRSECRQIPSLLTLANLPSSHVILFYAQFDITAQIFLYARLTGSIAPSVDMVMTNGVNKTCEGLSTCKIYLTHLEPETAYDVYYWYRSEQGIEPITPISSMKYKITTTPIQPFNLTIHDLQSEMNYIAVAVSIEDRSGYVWCMASRSSTVPSLPQLKSTQPIFFQEDNGVLVKIIPDLDVDKEYHGYCYAEDIYGVSMYQSIQDTHFIMQTRDDTVDIVTSIQNEPTESTVIVNMNRDGMMCCMYRDDSIIPTYDIIMSTSSCVSIEAYLNSTLTTEVEDDYDYSVYCAFNTTTYNTIYEDDHFFTIHTPSLNPTFTFLDSYIAHNMITLSFISDRSADLYCLPSSYEPSITEIKQGVHHYFYRNEMYEMNFISLEKETEYDIYCYGETTEGLPMVNSQQNMTFTLTTLTTPASISILSSSIQYNQVRLVISTTLPITLRCIALPSDHSIPTEADFSTAEAKSISIMGEYTIDDLEENTDYTSYCYGEDDYGRLLANPINETAYSFKTPYNLHSIFTSYLSQTELSTYISVVSTADCSVWCTVKHINDIYLSPSLIKQQVQPQVITKEVPSIVSFTDLTPSYSYQAYCYSESMNGLPMLTSIASTSINYTTPSYPILTVTLSALTANPSSSTIDLDISSTTKGTVFCRAREVIENQLPPTSSWIREGSSLIITQELFIHYMKLSSLHANTEYTVYCLGESEDGTESIQSLATRSLNAVTLQDTTPPSIFISSSIPGYSITTQPYTVNITFSEPIQGFEYQTINLTNARIIQWNQISNQLFIMTVAPLSHGEFSIKIPSGVVKDLYDNVNTELIHSRYYEPASLHITVQEIGKLYVNASVQYSYPAMIGCIISPLAVAPSTCSELHQDPTAIIFNNQETTQVLFNDQHSNTTMYLYCCATEANDIPMSNTIQSTQAIVEFGWFDCPFANNQVCNGKGTCNDGTTCVCDTGYYGTDCTASCPGLLSMSSSNYECSNHGVCNAASLECTCSSDLYAAPACTMKELVGENPATGYNFAYIQMNIQVSNPEVSSLEYVQNKEAFITQVAAIAGINTYDMRIQQWNVNQESRKLSESPSNVEIVMNVKKEETQKKIDTVKSSTETLRSQLTSPSFNVTSIAVTKTYSTNPENTDAYTCYDGELSAKESDIDCGGSCTKKCEKNQHCFSNDDCKTGYCYENTCMSNMSGGMVILIILIILFIAGLVLLVVCLNTRRKNEKLETKTEIEMVKVRVQQEKRDLERLEQLDKQEEEELRRLEESIKNKQMHRNQERTENVVVDMPTQEESHEGVPIEIPAAEKPTEKPTEEKPTEEKPTEKPTAEKPEERKD